MNKKLSVLFIFMLLFQSMSGGFALATEPKGDTDGSSAGDIFTDVQLTDQEGNAIDEDEQADVVNAHVGWTLENASAEDMKDTYKLSFPEQVLVEKKEQGGLYEDATLGSYTLSEDGTLNVSFEGDVEEHSDASGEIVVEGLTLKQSEKEEAAGKEPVDNPESNKEDAESPKDQQDQKDNNAESNETQDNVKGNTSAEQSDKATFETASLSQKQTANSNKRDKQNGVENSSLENAESQNDNNLIKENIIDKDSVVIKTKDGTPVEDIDKINLEEVGKLELSLDWSLEEGHGYTAGAKFKFQLPKQFADLNLKPGQKLEGGYGTFTVDSEGLVTFTFNEMIENTPVSEGYFKAEVELDEQTITKTEDVLEFIVNDEAVERIPVNYEPTGGQAINKRGSHGKGGKFNTKSIEWEVDINTTLESLENATIKDEINEHQSLDTDSIKLYEADVDIEGNITSVDDTPVTLGDDNKSNENELKLDLENTNKAYQLTYTTNITDDEGISYSNEAVLSSDGKSDASTGASVSVQRQDHLNKSSGNFDEEKHSVDWEVEYNFDEKQLDANNELTDEFTFSSDDKDLSDRFEVTDIQIKQVDSFNEDGSVNKTTQANDVFDKDINGKKVVYTLNEDTNKPFIIEYTTQLKDDEYITHDGDISNTVTVDGETEESSQGVYQQVGDKSHSDINYEDKTIEWTIKINQDGQTLKNFKLEDDFSNSGQKLVDGSIDISPNTDAEPDIASDKEGFEINFGDISKPYTITYTTKFTYDFADDGDFYNSADLSYDTTNEKSYENTIDAGKGPNPETTSNGKKKGEVDQETKKITWTTDINYNQLSLDDANFIDPIEDNQSFIDGSVEIYKTSVDSSGDITKGNDVTDNYTVETNDGEKIEVNFGEIDQSYRIEFKTKDKDDIYNSDEKYENTATFKPRDDESHDLYAKVPIPHQGEFVGKSGTHNKDDWTVDWKVDINKSESNLAGVKIIDDLSNKNGEDTQILLEDSFKLDGEKIEEGEYGLEITDNGFKMNGLGDIDDHQVLTYSSYILTEETADLENNAHIKSNEEVTGTTEKEESVKVKIGSASGGATGKTATLVVDKNEKRTDTPVEGVQFQLEKTVGNQNIIVREGNTDENGKLNWSGLKYGDYTLHEKVPDNYIADSDYEEDSKDGYVSKAITLSSENMKDNKQTEEVENERKTGTVSLIKQDAVTEAPLEYAEFTIKNEDNGKTFDLVTNRKGISEKGVPFGTYTIEEIKAPDGYKVASDIDNFEIQPGKVNTVNVPNDAVINVAVDKTWDEVNKDYRPDDITVQVKSGDEVIDKKTITADDDWQHTFKGLKKYDDNGDEIDYKVAEKNLEGYDPEINKLEEDNNYEITNTQKTTDINVEKTWYDNEDATGNRPESITVKLMNDEGLVKKEDITADDDWKYTFNGLAEFNKDGDKINYTVEEDTVSEGYKTTINEPENNEDNVYNIINTRVGKTSIDGEKTWKDNKDETGDRPESITVKVLQNGEEKVSQEITAEDNWKYSFDDLDRFDESGTEYGYTVDEEPVEGYKKSADGNDLINVRTGETSVSGTKTWKDDNDAQGDRPDAIKVNLKQNGTVYAVQDVTKEDDWDYTFTHLPKYDDEGQAYDYTIKEQNVPGYDSEVNDFDLTNTRSETTSFEVTKSWLDEGSNDRPESVEVELFRSITDGDEESVEVFNLSDDNNWSRAFEDLQAFTSDGEAYDYDVEEESVAGYDTVVDGFDITNTRAAITSVKGEKKWLDEGASNRPDAIKVNLLQNGDEIDSTEVTTGDNWEYSFTGWAEYDNQGVAYNYTVEEEPVNGYETTIDKNNNITNTRIGTTQISGEKTWNDDDESDRPESITVNLMQNGDKFNSQAVTADDNWTYSFTDLAEFDGNGDTYTYSIEEEPVDGYDTEINGFDIMNTRTGTTEVTGEKTWKNDISSDRPDSITVNLLQNGEEIDSTDVTAEDNWQYSFTGLSEYDDQGEAYDYTVEEESVEGYETTIDGYDIINKLDTPPTPPTPGDPTDPDPGEDPEDDQVSVAGSKTWLDDETSDRPDSITVNLLQDGEEIKSKEVTADDDWNYSFTDLEESDEDDAEHNYTIEEEAVEGYETTVDGFDITNLRVDTTDVAGTKTWQDDEADDRPDNIKVNLLQDGKVIDTTKVTSDDDWMYSFTDLDKYDSEGKPFTYTVKEQDVPGYDTDVDGYDITNTRSETKSIGVTKSWQDDDAKDRPDAITIDLLQNGDVVDTVDVTADEDWTHTFEDLDAYNNDGVAYEYSVQEQDVEDYTTDINGFDITNTLEESTTEPEDPDDPNNGDTNDPEEPGDTGDPNNGGTDDSDKPGDTDDPNNGGSDDADKPGDPGDSDADDNGSKGDSEEKGDSADTDDSQQPGTNGDTDDTQSNEIPKTATNMFNLLALGALFTIIGLGLTVFRKVRSSRDTN